MAGSPVEVFIGWTALGAGVIMAYGVFKGESVFGADGILATTLKTGKIPSASSSGTTGTFSKTGANSPTALGQAVGKTAVTAAKQSTFTTAGQQVGTIVGRLFG